MALPQEGSGECRVPVAPAASCAKVESTRVSHHEFTGTPGIPARDGVNGFLRALPGDRALLSPSPPRISASRELDASVGASGPHVFAVREQHRPSSAPPASIASRPASVTLRNAPLSGAGPNRYIADLGSGSRKIRKIRNRPFLTFGRSKSDRATGRQRGGWTRDVHKRGKSALE